MDDPWYELATKIRRERERRGLSSTELARRLDVSRTTIHNWESGKPIPIERCVGLAASLEIPHDELLRLHPHAGPQHTAEAAVDSPSPFGNRLLLVAAGTLLLIAVAAAIAVWQVSHSRCLATGAAGGSSGGVFQDAYRELGGMARLGCALDEVHRQGPGVVQTFESGLLITFDRREVFLISEDILRDYSAIADSATSQVLGTFSSDVRQCGVSRVVLLEGGWGPGALVEISSGGEFLWLGPDLWVTYAVVGGPLGMLGSPAKDEVERSDDGESASFVGGSISRDFGGASVITPALGGAPEIPPMDFDITECEPAGVGASDVPSNG